MMRGERRGPRKTQKSLGSPRRQVPALQEVGCAPPARW